MSCQVGGQNVTAIKWCNAQGTLVDISSVKKDGATLWSSAPSPTDDFLTFTANTAGSTVRFSWIEKSGAYVMYNMNDQGWENYTADSTLTFAQDGDTIKFKGSNIWTDYTHRFVMSGSIAASGSVTSLCDGTGTDPSISLGSSQWDCMFYDCMCMTTAPKIIVSEINASGCMTEMFEYCTFSAAPTLSADSISPSATNCYRNIFNGCSNVTTVNMKTGCGYEPAVHGALASDHTITINYI